jgi:DNA (cytosine-5)-methyltransferase 1
MGGLSLGFRDAGYEIDEGLDVWDPAIKTYNHYIGGAKKVDISLYYPGKKDFDVVIVGGTPCQDFSLINKHRDIYSKRSQLVLDFCRIINAVKPVSWVFENVIHLSRWAEAALLELPGYKVTRNVIDSYDYGVPQRRRRKIFIGDKSRRIRLRPAPGSGPRTVREAFAGIPQNWGLTQHRPATVEKFKATTSTTWTSISDSGFEGAIRLEWDKPSCGIINVKRAQILHPEEDRVISLAEALSLQGFPSWYKPIADKVMDKGQLIADAVPPRLARNIAEAIL